MNTIDTLPRIAVVIVDYHKAEKVCENVAALTGQSIANQLDIVVVDNSNDWRESAKLRVGLTGLPCQLIVAHTNYGYTRSVNLGIASACRFGAHLLLVNPDIVVDVEDTIEMLAAQLEAHPEIGILASMQREDTGKVVEVARRFPNFGRLVLRRLFPGTLTDFDLLAPLVTGAETDVLKVDWVQSSFCLIRNSLWLELGGLDEMYRIFMADVALARDARRLGFATGVSGQTCVRADGLRASRGGLRALSRSRPLRIHVVDALKYQVMEGLALLGLRKIRPNPTYRANTAPSEVFLDVVPQ